MEEVIVAGVAAAIWAALMGVLIGRPLYIKVRERMSPKYAAARKVRLAQKSAHEEAARQQAREDESARLKGWATEHPDDETAQAYLATLPADTKSTTANAADEDIEAVLRELQAQDDASNERLRERRRKEALYLQWALEHPDNEVARRYLGQALIEANRNAQYGPNAAQARETVAAIEAALGVTSASHGRE
jgi:hypothetical protein